MNPGTWLTMNPETLSAATDAWYDAELPGYTALRAFMNDLNQPIAWAVRKGGDQPEMLLLWENRQLMAVTVTVEEVEGNKVERIGAKVWVMPPETVVDYRQEGREPRERSGDYLTHWTFTGPDVEPLSLDGFQSDNGRLDSTEKLALALAQMCGWPSG
jgi:hypothetical protein